MELKRTGRGSDLSPSSSTEIEWKLYGEARDKSFYTKPTNFSLEKNILYKPVLLAGTLYISVVYHVYFKS